MDRYYNIETGKSYSKIKRAYNGCLSKLPKSLRERIDGLFFIALAICIFALALTGSMIINIIILQQQRIGAVVSDAPECSDMGVAIINQGGNAVDAAIATVFCLGLYAPQYSGIGGGGFMLIYDPTTGKDVAVDFRETAPAAAYATMFKNQDQAIYGGLSVAIPGEVKGMEEAYNLFGKLEWSKILAPTISLANNGIIVSKHLADILEQKKSLLEKNSIFRQEFMKDGQIAKEGDIIRRPSLAKALQLIRDKKSAGFYSGPVAEEIVDYINANSGNFSLGDLSNYTVKLPTPISTLYKNHKVVGLPPPNGGGAVLYCLNILNFLQLNSTPNGWDYHRIVEAMKYGYAARTHFADMDFVSNVSEIVAKLMMPSFGENISRLIDDHTYEPSHYETNFDIASDHGTTHVSVIDRNGLTVSVTITVNFHFGSGLITPKYGIVLNDEMDDFSMPNTPNGFGLPPSKINFVEPNKRPQSSTSPIIILSQDSDGIYNKPVGVFGGSGGSRIISGVLQTILDVFHFGMTPYEAVAHKRLHDQLIPTILYIEEGFSQKAIDILKSIGHNATVYDNIMNAMIVLEKDGSFVSGGADPRKGGKVSYLNPVF